MESEIINRLSKAGLTLSLLPPDRIEVTPKDKITDELRSLIRANKPKLMEWLKGTQLPTAKRIDVSPKLKAASAALNAQIIASGQSLDAPPEPPPKIEAPTVPGIPTPTPKMPKVNRWEPSAAWRVIDQAYQQHHNKCPVCIAAGQGRGSRCGAGAALWVNYTNAVMDGEP